MTTLAPYTGNIKDTSSSSGSGQPIVVDGAPPTGYLTFDARGNGAAWVYRVQGRAGSTNEGEWEDRYGVVNTSGSISLSYGFLIASSNGGSPVTWAGSETKDVFVAPTAEVLNGLLAGNVGTSRPPWLQAHGRWTDSSAAPVYTIKIFDGTDDIPLGSYNATTNVFTAAGVDTGTAAGQIPVLNSDAVVAPLVGGMPIGAVIPVAVSAAPTGWLLCFGQAVSRTTYAKLFAAIGTTYGAGNGSTTFNVPDIRGRVVAGQDDMGGTSSNRLTGQAGGVNGDTLGGTGGEETHENTIAEMPAHDHSYTEPFINNGIVGGGGAVVNKGSFSATSGSAGGGDPHNNVQPTIILNYAIFAAA